FATHHLKRTRDHRPVPAHFIRPASRQQQHARSGVRLWTLDFGLWTSSHHRMPDKLHAELRHAARVPVPLERENAQEQIVILRERVSAARARGPHLRRDELDYPWI